MSKNLVTLTQRLKLQRTGKRHTMENALVDGLLSTGYCRRIIFRIHLKVTKKQVFTIYNSEAVASELLENLEDIFPMYYVHSITIYIVLFEKKFLVHSLTQRPPSLYLFKRSTAQIAPQCRSSIRTFYTTIPLEEISSSIRSLCESCKCSSKRTIRRAACFWAPCNIYIYILLLGRPNKWTLQWSSIT